MKREALSQTHKGEQRRVLIVDDEKGFALSVLNNRQSSLPLIKALFPPTDLPS